MARRREEPAQTVPIPITTISSTDLTMSSAFDARDLDRMVPNLSYGSSPVAKNTASVFLRGIGQTNWGPAQDPKVGTYVDGVYLARPQGGIFDLLDVERIEILRGPQGTLYGRNTTAGLVHVVTRQPTDEFAAELRLGAGQDGQSLMSGTMSVPLGDTLSTRIAVQQRRQDGFVTNRFDGTSWNDLNRTTARVITRWRPSETFEARLAFDGQRMRERPTLGSCSWVGPEDGAEANGLAGLAWLFGSFDALKENCRAQGYLVGYEDDPEANHDVDAHGVSLTIRRDIARIGTLTSITALRDTRERNGSWSTGGDSKAGGLIDVRQPTDRDNTFRQWTQEFRLEGTAESIDWVAGIFLFDEEGMVGLDIPLLRDQIPPQCEDVPQFCFPAGPGITLGDIALGVRRFGSNSPTFSARNRSHAIFAELNIDLSRRLQGTVGVRYTEDRRRLDATVRLIDGTSSPSFVCADGSLPNLDTCRNSLRHRKTTPRFILNYRIANNVLAYASWSEGYSSPGIDQSPLLTRYDAEVSQNIEAGIKSAFWRGRAQLNVTMFRNTYRNQQQLAPRVINRQPLLVTINAQRATLRGIETELTLAPRENLLIRASHGYVHGDYDEFSYLDTEVGPAPAFMETEVLRDLSTTKVVRGSPYTYHLSVIQSFDLKGGATVKAQLGWSFRGRRYDELEAPARSRQAKYGLLHGRVSWEPRDGRTTFSLWGSNLTNRRYTTRRDSAEGNILRRVWGEPKIVGHEFVRRFGL